MIFFYFISMVSFVNVSSSIFYFESFLFCSQSSSGVVNFVYSKSQLSFVIVFYSFLYLFLLIIIIIFIFFLLLNLDLVCSRFLRFYIRLFTGIMCLLMQAVITKFHVSTSFDLFHMFCFCFRLSLDISQFIFLIFL